MSHYIVAQISIHDRQTYSQYEQGFMEIFSAYNGTMLAVDEQPHVLEGDWPATRTVLIKFPDREDALAWYQSDEYQALAKFRVAASDGHVVLISGLPQ